MKREKINLIIRMVRQSMPKEHNWHLIETVVRKTIEVIEVEQKPWWKKIWD